jgi:DNA repair protein RadC
LEDTVDNQSSHPSSYSYSIQELSLEDTVKAFIPASSRDMQELTNATMSNSQTIQELKNVTMNNSQTIQELKNEVRDSKHFTHQAIAKMERQIDYLVAKFNRIEEEELQSQLMARRHYLIDEDESSNSYHMHVKATTIHVSEEIVDNNEEEEK